MMQSRAVPQRVPPERPKTRFSEPTLRNVSRPAESRSKTTKPIVSRSAPTPRVRHFSKIAKNTKKRRDPISSDLAQQLSDQLDNHREHLFTTTKASLNATEARHKKAIDALEAQFNEKLQLLANQESIVPNDLYDEKIRIPDPDAHKDPDGKAREPKVKEVYIRDRASAFEKFVERKRAEVDKLFTEWNTIQIKIIGLAVKMLGKETIHFNRAHMFDKLSELVERDNGVYERNSEERQDEVAIIGDVEKAIKALSKETGEAIDGIYQEFDTERKRRQALVKKAQKEAEEFM